MLWPPRWMVFLVACVGCSASAAGTVSTPDKPLPPGEPLDAVTLAVDLPRSGDCEEAFDLALYQNRAVHLIEWDADAGRCTNRKVRIVYVRRQIARDDVVAEVRRRASTVVVVASP